MEQIMTQKDAPEVTKELQWVEWFPEGGMLTFSVRFRWPGQEAWEHEDREVTICREGMMHDRENYFDRLLPDGEYSFEEEGTVFARMDEFNNMHWLLKDHKGLIHHKVVNIKPILEQIAEEKS